MTFKNTRVENEINSLFEQLVPFSGKASSLAGEMVRAYCRITYRYFNDGDVVFHEYGNETCNAPWRFLYAYGDDNMKSALNDLRSSSLLQNDKKYVENLEVLGSNIIDTIGNNPEYMNRSTPDMFDYSKKEDSIWSGYNELTNDY